MASQDWLEKDFYATLGVPSDADDAAIKKAYRKLARQLHPDQNSGDEAATRRFKEVGEAYGVLSDPEQRREYDQIRAMARGGARFTAGGGGAGGFEDLFSQFGGAGGPGGPRVRYSTGGAGGAGGAGGPDLSDLLGGLFGGQFGGAAGGGFDPTGFEGYGASRGPRKGADVQARTTLSFRDAVQGATVTLNTGGSGGSGSVTTRIPAGVRDGQKIRLRGKGRPGEAGASAGDLIITVTVSPDPVFRRDGDNLVLDLPVTFAEAALGATVEVPTLDGSRVKVRVAPGTPSGRQLRVKGRGVGRDGATGDLLARVQVVVPQRLTDAAKEAIERLREDEDGIDPRAELYAKAARP